MKNYQNTNIVPFYYNESYFSELKTEDNHPDAEPLFQNQFVKKAFYSDSFNKFGKRLLTEDEKDGRQILQHFSLTDDGRKTCGLHKNKNYRYQLRRRGYKFQFGEIEAWFFSSGIGFLTFQVKGEFPDWSEALDFNAMWRPSSGTVFQWENRRMEEGNLVSEIISLSVRELYDRCLNLLDDAGVRREESKNYNLLMVLTDETPEIDEQKLMNKLCLRQALERGDSGAENEVQYFNRTEYIRWATSKSSLAVLGDYQTAEKLGRRNRDFLQNNFPFSVFHNYLALYLYYIQRNLECERLELIALSLEQDERNHPFDISQENYRDFLYLDDKLRPMTEEGYSHIDRLFRETLCRQVWNLQKRLGKLKNEIAPQIIQNKKYDVFISYRHDSGQYLALLLYRCLSEKGVSVFWDYESLRAGHYEEQIYEVLDQCKNVIMIVSPGCIDRLKEDGDWVRKEIAYVFKNNNKKIDRQKTNVIMAAMEGEEFPQEKDADKLPEDVRELVKFNGIPCPVAYFDGAIKRLFDNIKLVKNQLP